MPGIQDLLENIRKRPKMYLGSLSITKLHVLLTGYEIGRMEAKSNKIEEFKLQNFQQWIQKKWVGH